MTTDTIITSLNDWAASREIQIIVFHRSQPPAFLDMRPLLNDDEADSAGGGILVTIEAVDQSGAHLGFWIPSSLKKGTWSSQEEDEDEIGIGWIPEFGDEASLIGFVDRTADAFFLQYNFEAALDEWLADNGHSYEVVEKKEFSGEAAEEAFNGDLMNWLFIEFQDAGGYDITLGISGKGEAATFYSDEEGFLTFDQRVEGIKTGADLTAWLESSITSKS